MTQFSARYSKGGEIDEAVLGASEEERAQMEMPFRKRNFRILLIVAVGIGIIFASRAAYLSLIRGEHYASVSQGNTIRTIPTDAPRGGIFDRYGYRLAYSVPASDLVFRLSGDTETLPEETFSRLEELFGISRESAQEAIQLAKRRSERIAVLKSRVSQEEALRFSEQSSSFPNIEMRQSLARRYEDSVIFSHIIGYESPLSREDVGRYPEYLLTDSVGRQGLERQYESFLRGTHGSNRVEVDARGAIRREISSQAAVAGNDLVLHIDARLQKVLFDALRDQLSSGELTRAAAVALDPKTGGVLALVSLPSYDNNGFAERNPTTYASIIADTDQPLFNRAISGEYPPASTIKPVLAAAALSEGVVSPETKIESRGGISVGSTFFGDWKAHGFTDVREAIAVSSDVFFYAVGGGYGNIRGMGMETMGSYERRFGFGSITGIDLAGESKGLVPSPQWKEDVIGERWYIGNTYHASIGQGYMKATPLQVAVSTAAIVNGGVWHEPKLVSYIRSPEGNIIERIEGETHNTGIDSEILRIVREGMRMTVTEGTATALNDLPVAVAGKTGTAEFGVDGKTHGWFVSFAPYENPEIVLAILVESQDDDGYHTVPITKRVYEAYFGDDTEE
jgi:penicillin-binding protein 2